MDPRISFVTLAVDDLDAVRRFYVDGLGWRADLDVPDEVVMIRVGERQLLSLWAAGEFEQEVGPIRRGRGVSPITLAHNVLVREEVDAILELARTAGASEVSSAEVRPWGGYSGYFADPAGFRWEVAVNPGPIGQSVLPPALRDEVRRTDHGEPIGPPVPHWTPPPRPEVDRLVGRWCVVERLAAEHADELYPEITAPGGEHLWTYLSSGPPAGLEDLRARLARRLADGQVHLAIRDAEGVACGTASLLRIDEANGCVEVGAIMLGPRLRRTTAATEAISLLTGHVFDLGYRRLEWKCDALNAHSRRAAQRLGFSYEGTFRRHVVIKGRSRDTAWFALTVDDWPRVAAAHAAWLDPANFVDGVQRRRLADLLAAG